MIKIKGGAQEERVMHFLISIFEHANAIEDKLNSREVRENRVRKPYGWNSVELKLCDVIQKQVE